MLNLKEIAYSEVRDILSDLISLCRTRELPVSDLVAFWSKVFLTEPRIVLLASPGADAILLFEKLTGIRPEQQFLLDWIIEAHPQDIAHALLLSDGSVIENIDHFLTTEKTASDRRKAVLIMPGSHFLNSIISIAVCNSIHSNPLRMSIDEWLDRASLPIIVSPATAVLGKTEVELMKRFSKEDRMFVVAITGIEGETQRERDLFIEEIETFKLRSLRQEIGPFAVIYATRDDESIQSMKAELEKTLRGNQIEQEKLRHLSRVVSHWLEQVASAITQRCIADQNKSEYLEYISTHLQQQVKHFDEIIFQECLAEGNHLHEQLKELALECERSTSRFSNWLRLPGDDWRLSFGNVWSMWSDIINAVKDAPQRALERIKLRLNSETQEFLENYSETLGALNLNEVTIGFSTYQSNAEQDSRLSVRRFQEAIEKKASEIITELKSDGPKNTELEGAENSEIPEDERNKRSDLLDSVKGVVSNAMRKRKNESEEILDLMRRLIDETAKPAISDKADALSGQIAQQIKASYSEAFKSFELEVESRISDTRKNLLGKQIEAEYLKMSRDWKEAISMLTK